jgi:type IV pilus assembly protein PilQ
VSAPPASDLGVRHQLQLREPAGRRGGAATPQAPSRCRCSTPSQPLAEPGISALEADGKGKLVSSPRVVTADQTKALIEQGTEFPYQQATSSGATSISFRKAVLKLEVTPQITPEGNIILDAGRQQGQPRRDHVGRHRHQHQAHQTEVLVENGGTVVIGGIFELTETKTNRACRCWAKCPVLGRCSASANALPTRPKCSSSSRPKMITDRNAAR